MSMQKQPPEVFYKKGALRNFAKFSIISPCTEENCPETQNLTLTIIQTLTLTGGNFPRWQLSDTLFRFMHELTYLKPDWLRDIILRQKLFSLKISSTI